MLSPAHDRECAVAAFRWFPPCLIYYHTRGLVSTSTAPETIARMEPSTVLLCNNPSEAWPQKSIHRRSTGSGPLTQLDEEPDAAESPELPEWAKEFYGAGLRGCNLRAIRAELIKISGNADIPAVGRRIAEFGLKKAQPRGRKTIKAGSLCMYLRLLLIHLAPHLRRTILPM